MYFIVLYVNIQTNSTLYTCVFAIKSARVVFNLYWLTTACQDSFFMSVFCARLGQLTVLANRLTRLPFDIYLCVTVNMFLKADLMGLVLFSLR